MHVKYYFSLVNHRRVKTADLFEKAPSVAKLKWSSVF